MNKVALIFMMTWLFATVAAGSPATADDKKSVGFEIRTAGGDVVIASEEIVSYEWATHTMTLKPGVWEAIPERLQRFCPKQNLNQGIPFDAVVDGKPVYRGTWKSIDSSLGNPGMVICYDMAVMDKDLQKDQLRIDAGYPTDKKRKVTNDPRINALIKTALQKQEKLK